MTDQISQCDGRRTKGPVSLTSVLNAARQHHRPDLNTLPPRSNVCTPLLVLAINARGIDGKADESIMTVRLCTAARIGHAIP